MKNNAAVAIAVCCLIGAPLLSSCAAGNRSKRAAATYGEVEQKVDLTIRVNSDYDISLTDPRGRKLRFGKGVSEWQNDLLANYLPVAGEAQIDVKKASWGVWKLKVALDEGRPVLTVQTVATGGCPTSDTLFGAEGGYAYSYDLQLTPVGVGDTCRATLKRLNQEKLRK